MGKRAMGVTTTLATSASIGLVTESRPDAPP
jgi:hypothetical protein